VVLLHNVKQCKSLSFIQFLQLVVKIRAFVNHNNQEVKINLINLRNINKCKSRGLLRVYELV
jgi:hypothetical protein